MFAEDDPHDSANREACRQGAQVSAIGVAAVGVLCAGKTKMQKQNKPERQKCCYLPRKYWHRQRNRSGNKGAIAEYPASLATRRSRLRVYAATPS